MKIWQFKLVIFIFINAISCVYADDTLKSITALSTSNIINKFVVFDGTLYKNKPDMSRYGIKPIRILYAANLWERGQDRSRLPHKSHIYIQARQAKTHGQITVIDIEHWPLSGNKELTLGSLQKYLAVLWWFKDRASTISAGYYSFPPISDYKRSIQNPSSSQYLTWRAENDRIHALADEVDIFFPSLYTYYTDREGWVKSAIAIIGEARRYPRNKPVYVFLWPQYHNSNSTVGSQFLPPDYWKLQLETAKQYADGLVIWGGWAGGPMPWDENAPWWNVTKKFMQELNSQ